MKRLRGAAARTQWRAMIEEQERSGQSAAAYCEARAIRRKRFFGWKRRLREEAAPAFVELHQACEPAIELRLAGGRSLVVRRGFDAALLREVVAALEAQA